MKNVKLLIQGIIVVWAGSLCLVTLCSSVYVLCKESGKGTAVQAPERPKPPNPLPGGGFGTNVLAIYTQEVAAYQQAVNAYKAYTDSVKQSDASSAFTLVVKETFGPFLSQLIVGFLAYAFVKSGAGVVDNLNRVRHNQAPGEIKLFD